MTQALPIDCATAAPLLRAKLLDLGLHESSFVISVVLPNELRSGYLTVRTTSQHVFARLRKESPHEEGGWPVKLITSEGPIAAPWPNDPQVETKYHGRVFHNETGDEVPFDELVIFRSRDNAFPQALEAYIIACQRISAPLPHIVAARGLLHRVQDWREKNKELCRIPGSQRCYSMTELVDAEVWENVLNTTITHPVTSVTLHDADKRVAATILLTQMVAKQQTPQGETFAGGPVGIQIQCEALGLDLKFTDLREQHYPLIGMAQSLLLAHLPHEADTIRKMLGQLVPLGGSCARG